jgi:hypothetical protein
MKNKIVSIGIVLMTVIGTSFAQELDNREKFEIGAKVGLNFSNVWDSEGQDFVADTKAGFALGAYVGIPLNKYIGLQPEVMLSQKGFKGGGSLLGFPYYFTRTTTYLDIPLLIQVKPLPFLTLLAGPQFSYLFNEKNVYTFASNSTQQEQAFNNEDARNNILGFVFGADIVYSYFVLSGRVGWGFQTNNQNGSSTTPRYKNQWLQFTVGVKI